MSADLNIQTPENWYWGQQHPIVIAGPCSAESEEQVLTTARQLAQIPMISTLRAGVWKPRTRPDGFEGAGENAIQWLLKAREETGLKLTVEVAKPEHVELCLKHDIDMLWIGARTSANPFSVQEIAESLKGIDIPVMVKNPVHPDLKLWIGAIERLNKSGIQKLMAVHRGFFTHEKTSYRNLPLWEIPIELKRLCPTLPILCDPSHISGKRKLLASVTQKAMDLAFDGIMIESHFNPTIAKTDANQQITPENLKDLLSNLMLRQEKGNAELGETLENLRFELDRLDHDLLEVLGQRMDKIREIGNYKKDRNMTVLQIERLRSMILERIEVGKDLNLDQKFVLKLLQLVHNESIRIQTGILNEEEEIL